MPEIQCPQCGATNEANAAACKYCGASFAAPQQAPQQPVNPQQPPVNPQQPYGAPQQPYGVPQQPYGVPVQPVQYDPSMQKSKVAAGILGILLGSLGIHNFYLGYTGKAVAQLLISVLSCGILSVASWIWGLVEGIQILTGSINVDARGIPLKD